jgi:predicted nucleic acid-binding protein
MIFIDTNIWCYYLDARLPEHGHVVEPLRGILKGSEVAINTAVAMEVAHYLTRNLDEQEARDRIESFVNLSNMDIVNFDRALMNTALDYIARFGKTEGLGGRDSTIIATLDKLRIETLLTHDKNLAAIVTKLGIKTMDPIP